MKKLVNVISDDFMDWIIGCQHKMKKIVIQELIL